AIRRSRSPGRPHTRSSRTRIARGGRCASSWPSSRRSLERRPPALLLGRGARARGRRPMNEPRPAVLIEDAVVTRGGREVLGPVSLAVGESEVVALVGTSGAGKSTLLRLVNGLYAPARGRVLTFGEVPSSGGPELRRRIGYVAQSAGLFPHRTVAQN